MKQKTDEAREKASRERIMATGDKLFGKGMFHGSKGIAIPYRLLQPEHSSGQEKYPLVLVLHGSGAIGTDNTAQLGILARMWALPSVRSKYPAFVVAPQFPRRSSNYSMDQHYGVLASVPDTCLLAALDLVDSLKKALPVNERQIYITGFSMGGSGVINCLELRPGLFAAAASVSGIPSFRQLKALSKTPLLLVHGAADTENPPVSDSVLYRKLHDINPNYITYWEIEGLAHSIYPVLYMDALLPRWLFGMHPR